MENNDQILSSHLCSNCGGKAPDWKCPKCNTSSSKFDPLHFQKCEGTMMQAKCGECDEAESKCTCEPVNK